MACAYPFRKIHQHTFHEWQHQEWINIPCGWCLNCRKDKQNYLIDRAEYEYKKRLTASFVTFTYDNPNLLIHCAVRDENGRPTYDKNGNLIATCRVKDVRDFIHAIREYIKQHKEIQGVLCQPDFSYMYVCEYGDAFKRPHAHVIFFGLDFAFCEKIIFERWKYGFIDVLPVLDGGIRYVTKYMDKQVYGKLAQTIYDDNYLERPTIRCSQGFGKGLLLDNIKDIKEHNLTYKAGKVRRPISSYWKSLLFGKRCFHDPTRTRKYICDSIDRVNEYCREVNLPPIEYDHWNYVSVLDAKEKASAYTIQRAKLREYNYKLATLNSGLPYTNLEQVLFSRFGRPTYDHDKVRRLPNEIKHWLAHDYVERLRYGDDVPF